MPRTHRRHEPEPSRFRTLEREQDGLRLQGGGEFGRRRVAAAYLQRVAFEQVNRFHREQEKRAGYPRALLSRVEKRRNRRQYLVGAGP
jgi:hypothetical protein